MLRIQKGMSNNLRVNVLHGFNYQMPQFQVSSAYTKRAMAKNVKFGSTYPVLPYCIDFVKCTAQSYTPRSSNFLSEGYISYYITVRALDILRNMIVPEYVTLYQMNEFYENILIFNH